jgi:hypothetical protein
LKDQFLFPGLMKRMRRWSRCTLPRLDEMSKMSAVGAGF